ncbi:MAG: GNAT family N-acetyltransferase [Tepidisphaeraceae bacterium]|jgi:GNAT superfamily N-acetyltransferase
MTVIVPAAESDVPTILDFIRKLAEYEKLSHEMNATEAQLREHLFGARPAAEAIVAKIGPKPVGFALFFTTFSTFAGRPGIWLEDLFVLPEHRRKGIGWALLKAVAAIAVQRKCARLEWSVLDWNQPAIKLYQKLGAAAMSDWTTQRLWGDALLRLAGK